MSQNILLSSIDKAIVAHYEAGHAVIAHCLGLAVEHVSLGSASLWGVSLAGHTRVPECLAENPAYSERCLWITLAGPAAHARYDPVGYQRVALPALATSSVAQPTSRDYGVNGSTVRKCGARDKVRLCLHCASPRAMPLDHYVSQVHLKNFYSPALGSRMYAMRKRDLKSFTPNSQSVCRIEDGSTNAFLKDDRMIEEFLKKIEPNYNSALAKLTENRIDSECIFTIAGFAAYVFACSPTAVRIFTTPIEDMATNCVAAAEKSGILPTLPDELGGYSLTKLLRTQK